MNPTAQALDPEVVFRHALNFDYSGALLSNATGAILLDRVAAGTLIDTTIPAPPDVQTPGGILLPMPNREPTHSITVQPQEMLGIPTVIPMLVLQSFATELYLKCILVLNSGQAPHIHQLVQLYQQLLPAQQRRMEELYNAECQSDLAFQELQRSTPREQFTITFALQEMNRAFELWRYAYESIPRNSFLGHPWIAVARLILELRQDWIPIAQSRGTLPTFQVR